jgi:hypothetical protein
VPQFITTGPPRFVCFAHWTTELRGGGWVFIWLRSQVRVKMAALRYCRRWPTPGPMVGIDVGQRPNRCTPLAITTVPGEFVQVVEGSEHEDVAQQ